MIHYYTTLSESANMVTYLLRGLWLTTSFSVATLERVATEKHHFSLY